MLWTHIRTITHHPQICKKFIHHVTNSKLKNTLFICLNYVTRLIHKTSMIYNVNWNVEVMLHSHNAINLYSYAKFKFVFRVYIYMHMDHLFYLKLIKDGWILCHVYCSIYVLISHQHPTRNWHVNSYIVLKI